MPFSFLPVHIVKYRIFSSQNFSFFSAQLRLWVVNLICAMILFAYIYTNTSNSTNCKLLFNQNLLLHFKVTGYFNQCVIVIAWLICTQSQCKCLLTIKTYINIENITFEMYDLLCLNLTTFQEIEIKN